MTWSYANRFQRCIDEAMSLDLFHGEFQRMAIDRFDSEDEGQRLSLSKAITQIDTLPHPRAFNCLNYTSQTCAYLYEVFQIPAVFTIGEIRRIGPKGNLEALYSLEKYENLASFLNKFSAKETAPIHSWVTIPGFGIIDQTLLFTLSKKGTWLGVPDNLVLEDPSNGFQGLMHYPRFAGTPDMLDTLLNPS